MVVVVVVAVAGRRSVALWARSAAKTPVWVPPLLQRWPVGTLSSLAENVAPSGSILLTAGQQLGLCGAGRKAKFRFLVKKIAV